MIVREEIEQHLAERCKADGWQWEVVTEPHRNTVIAVSIAYLPLGANMHVHGVFWEANGLLECLDEFILKVRKGIDANP